MKKKGSDSSEILITIYQITRLKIPHNRNVHIYCLKYFKCHHIQLRSSRTLSNGQKHLVNYIRYKFLKENDTMITTRNNIESNFCSIFEVEKHMRHLPEVPRKNISCRFRIMPVLCKILTELCITMISLNKGRDKLHETRVLKNTVFIRNVFCCCRFEAVIVVSRLRSFGSWKRVILKTSTNFPERRNSSVFYPEDKGSKFLRNVRTYLPDYVRPDPCFMRR